MFDRWTDPVLTACASLSGDARSGVLDTKLDPAGV
jgi:hypothetical protein